LFFVGYELADAYSPLFGLFLYNFLLTHLVEITLLLVTSFIS